MITYETENNPNEGLPGKPHVVWARYDGRKVYAGAYESEEKAQKRIDVLQETGK